MNSSISVSRDGRSMLLLYPLWLMIAAYLAVDAVYGYLQLSGQGGIPLSPVFKVVVLGLGGACLAALAPLELLPFLTVLLVMTSATFLRILGSGSLEQFTADLSMAAKLATPLFFFAFSRALLRAYPRNGSVMIIRVLNWSVFIVAVNLILGILGYGFSTYVASGIGVKGFFYAGNEISGVFIISVGWLMGRVWTWSRGLYLPIALLSILSGVLIATKAAFGGAVLLSLLVPICAEIYRGKGLIRTLSPLIGLLFIFAFSGITLVNSLQEIAAYQRFISYYNQVGVLGALFTGRVDFVADAHQLYFQELPVISQITGIGSAGALKLLTHGSAEVDPVDLLLWFGIPGLLIAAFIYFYFVYVSFYLLRVGRSGWAGVVFAVNIVLVAASILSGHILTSGMIGILWGVFNAVSLVDPSYLTSSTGMRRGKLGA